VDPIAFRCGLGDYESEIQAELEEALENEDDSDIEFIDDMDGEE
jgi:flagellar assembly factor FliW